MSEINTFRQAVEERAGACAGVSRKTTSQHPGLVASIDEMDLPDRLLGKKAVTRMIDCSYTTIWNWMRHGQFPRAIDCNGIPKWRLSELTTWIASRERRRIKGDPPPPAA